MTRRDCLSQAVRGPLVQFLTSPRSGAAPSLPDVQRRIREIVHGYEVQGFHRTGTETDRISGDWLMTQVRGTGLTAAREPFSLTRVDPITCSLIVNDRKIDGLPLFDGGFTGPAGIRGRLGPLGSGSDIGVVEAPPNSAAAGPLGDARRQNRHRAIVMVTQGRRPGLCPSNADNFLSAFGPPVLQVSRDEAQFLREQSERASEAVVIAEVKRTRANSCNVVAFVRGSDRTLPSLIVMTPRSGWWTCASERGGGLGCWLELMRAMRTMKPARDVLFVASSGHEVGYLGIHSFVERRPGIVAKSLAWMHFGANIGAAQEPANVLQASDDDMEKMMAEALGTAALRIDRRVPRGTVPGGEVGVVHLGGGRYVSIIGGNALFHNPADHGPEAIDTDAIARFASAFAAIAGRLVRA